MRPERALVLYSLAAFVILEVMLVAAVLYWPNFAQNVEAFKLIAPLPFMKDAVALMAREGAVPYINAQQYFKGCNTLGTAAAVLFAVGAVAGEVHRGTLEIWLARPYSRTRMLTQRWLGGALALALPVFASSATIPWLAERVGESLRLWPFMLCSAHQFIVLLAVYGIAFLCSACGSNPTRIALVLLFVTTFEFSIYMIQTVTHWSFFRVSDIQTYQRIHATLSLDWRVCGPLLGVSAAAYAAALFAFRRRVP